MDTHKIPADDPEMQWIAKYRKALDQAAIVVGRSRGAKARDAIVRMCGLLTTRCRKLLSQWIGPDPVRPITIIKPGIAEVQKSWPPNGRPRHWCP
jgi:hypothetical protein